MIMTADEIVNEMTMSYSHLMHIVVEGESDQKFFISVMKNHRNVNVISAFGSDGVVEVINLFDKYKSATAAAVPALGIIDRDYKIPNGKYVASQNILLTDHRDIECMMVDSPSLISVLNELGSVGKISKFGDEHAIRAKLTDVCKTVGELRYLSQHESINFTFQKLDYEKFVDKKNLILDPIKLVEHIAGAQPKGVDRISLDTLERARKARTKAKDENGKAYFIHDLLICRGHDLTALMALGLRSLWGSRKVTELSISVIEGYLRVAYLGCFKNSNLYKNMVSWVSSNGLSPRVVL